MRVTNSMMVNDLKRNLNTNLEHLNNLQEQLSTGRKINKPSDDPAGLVKSLRLRTNITEGQQYQSNISGATSFMQTTDAALQSINDIMQRVRELTVKAATGTNDTSANQAISEEISQLEEQLQMVANSTYGSKYIFGGTNVTEAPYQNGTWTGNDQALQLEIGQGVTLPINIPEMKEFFTGKLNDLKKKYDKNTQEGITSVSASDLQEGQYIVNTTQETTAVPSKAMETQSYLGSIAKNAHFFYKDAENGASLGAGTGSDPTNLANDSAYNGSLLIEVKNVTTGVENGAPRVTLTDSSTANPVMQFDRPLYIKDATGSLTQISTGDLAQNFTYTGVDGSTGTISGVNYDSTTGKASFSLAGTPVKGDTIVWNNDSSQGKTYSKDGKEYVPVKAVFDGTKWVYDDIPKVTATIKGHIYTSSGDYQYVELDNVDINMETQNGQQLFKISAADLNNSAFTQDLVIWNNSGAALGGIDPTNPQIKVGDKTVISFSAADSATDAQKVDVNYTYNDVNGDLQGQCSHSFTFQNGYFNNKTQELKFFTLNQQTGISYDGSISVGGGTNFVTQDKAVSFSYQAGLFNYVRDLAKKVAIGKLPEVGNELAGNDSRLQDLLTKRSTIGAKINRLELQQNRLESTEAQLTSLLSTTEDANEAEVIMNLKMEENVYQASLSAGARIVQPTLVDFLK